MTTATRIAMLAGTCVALGLGGCSSEEKVSIGELPPAVRATLDHETVGGTVTSIEKEKKDGKVVYSADAKVGGKEWDICIAENGLLISKDEEK